jgi:hypothetical protein
MTFSPRAIEAGKAAIEAKRAELQHLPLARIYGELTTACLTAALAVDGLALQGWQPIKSAPKDGTPVDLWCANSEFPNRVTDAQWRKPTESEWFVHGGDGMKTADAQWIDPCGWPMGGDESPTHWMPLPAPPAASEGEERR